MLFPLNFLFSLFTSLPFGFVKQMHPNVLAMTVIDGRALKIYMLDIEKNFAG